MENDQPVAAGQAEVSSPVASPEPAATPQAQSGAQTPAPVTPPVDVIESLKAEVERLQKSYKEAQGFTTKQAQANAELRRQFAALQNSHKSVADTLAKAMRAPHDPDQFLQELKTKGPDYLNELLDKRLQESMKPYAERADRADLKATVTEMRHNKDAYPDFDKLSEDMAKIAQTPGAIPADLPIDEYMDALYNAARLLRAKDAVKEAEANGRKQAEESLARESRTTVVGGGKQGATKEIDPKTATLAQLKEMLRAQGLVEE